VIESQRSAVAVNTDGARSLNVAGQPLVSVVTPVYNGAEHLSECIESVLAQTYQNWEYIIVDNRSTDASSKIAHRYADADSRIRVHKNQQFLPAIANHNAALRQISLASKYCKVVFADDLIRPECLEKMVRVADTHPSVGLVSAHCLEGEQVICKGLPESSTVVSGRETCRRHLLERLYLFGSANSVLYRADLVRGRDSFYDEGNIHADNEVCFELLKTCDFGFVHEVLTFTRVREGSRNAVSSGRQTHFAGMLHILRRHGTHYLSPEELEKLLDQNLSEYYRFLSKSLFLRRDRMFWDYHKKSLAEAGFGFSRFRLMQATLESLFKAVLHPQSAMKNLARVGKKRLGYGEGAT